MNVKELWISKTRIFNCDICKRNDKNLIAVCDKKDREVAYFLCSDCITELLKEE